MMNRKGSKAKALLALILAITILLFPMDTLALTLDAQGIAGDGISPSSEYAATPDEAPLITRTKADLSSVGANEPHEHDDITFEAWESASSLPSSAGSYYLTADVTITGSWYPASGTNLDLNGHGILMTGSDSVIIVGDGKTLHIYNCNKETTHYVTLSSWRGTAVSDTGTESAVTNGSGVVKVNGGYITGGTGHNTGYSRGGALQVDGNSAVSLTGISILGNSADFGGALFINTEGSRVSFNDCVITYNLGGDGSLARMDNGTIALNDSLICNNKSTNRGCLCAYWGIKVILSGYTRFYDNLAKDDLENNIHLGGPAGTHQRFLGVEANNLSTGAHIGITMDSVGAITTGWSTSMGNADPADYFFSDKNDYDVLRIGGEARLIAKPYTLVHFAGGEASGRMESDFMQGSSTYTLPTQTTFTALPGKTLAGWRLGDVTYAPGETVTLGDEDVTFTAQWTDGVTVSFDAKGGSGIPTSKCILPETAIENPGKPKKDGYTFLCWTLNGEEYDFSAPVNEDITLCALWAKGVGVGVSFEDGVIPEGWTQTGDFSWRINTGDYNNGTAHGGSKNALAQKNGSGGTAWLIMPEMDLSGVVSAPMSFSYINRSWSGDIDVFGFYYRVDGGDWQEIFSTGSAHDWTDWEGTLPEGALQAHVQLGFKADSNYGYGVGLDDILLDAITPHEHDWTYTADGNVITATCSGMADGTCPFEAQTLTVNASSKDYDGAAVTATVKKSANWDACGLSDSYTVSYTGNTDPGTYTASVTLGEAVANAEFTITGEIAAQVIHADESTTQYYTVQNAINGAAAGETVQLLRDVLVTATITISKNLTFDLNGYGLISSGVTVFYAESKTWTLMDSSPERSTHYYTVDENGLAHVSDDPDGADGSFTGGYLTGTSSSSTYNSCIYVWKTNTTMTGGTVIGNQKLGQLGGAVYNRDSGTFTMKGGAFIYNRTTDSGGAFGINGGTLKIEGGRISHNRATNNGGAIATWSNYNNVVVNVSGGEITDNRAGSLGGGICFTKPSRNTNTTRGTISGGIIAGNVAANGGGISVDGKTATQCLVTMTGGSIEYNEGSGNTGGVLLLGGTTFTMSGGAIHHNAGLNFGGIGTSSATVALSGNVDISDNYSYPDGTSGKITKSGDSYTLDTAGGVPANVKTANANDRIKVTGQLQLMQKIGFTRSGSTGVFTTGWSTAMSDADPEDYFKSDSDDYIVIKNSGGEAEIIARPVATIKSDGNTTYYSDFSTALSAWTEGSTLKLMADVTTSSTITVPSGEHTLDLNGSGILMTGNDRVITINQGASLELNDSDPDRIHYITLTNYRGTAVSDSGEESVSNGNGVIKVTGGYLTGGYRNNSGSHDRCGAGVYNWGTFVMNGGSIVGNTLFNNSGGGIRNSGYFTMNGGTIAFNYASGNGGGVTTYVPGGSQGKMTMNGGEISDNYCGSYGGGIQIAGPIEMTGGSVVRNTAGSGGSGVFYDGKNDRFKLSGNPVIKDNHNNDDLYLGANATFMINGSLTEEADIHVLMNTPAEFTVGWKNIMGDADPAKYFVSENDNYVVLLNNNGEAEIGVPPVASVINGDTTTNYGSLSDALEGWKSGGKLALLKDASYSSVINMRPMYGYNAGEYVLDLNGKTLNVQAIQVGLNNSPNTLRTGPHLTVEDSETGGILRFSESGMIDYGGLIELRGGTLTGGNGTWGGLFLLHIYASLDMYDGVTLTGNTSTYGGAVLVGSDSEFNMYGGKISGNSASDSGGGVVIFDNDAARFNMYGGEISGNRAPKGGGVSVNVGSFHICGNNAVIKDNVKGGSRNSETAAYTGGTPNNVYLPDGKKVIIESELSPIPIGVTLQNGSGVFTTGLSGNGTAANFTSDNADYEVRLENGEAILKYPDLTGVTAEGFEGDYDGEAHGITVSAPDGAAIKYGTTEGSYTLTDNPTYTDAGTYTVYYEVSKEKHTSVYGSAQVKIDQINATVTITGHNTTVDYDSKAHSADGYDAVANSDLYDVTKDFNYNGRAEAVRSDIGTTVMGLSAEQFENLNANFASVTFEVVDGYVTINPVAVTVTITGHNDTAVYDGEAHNVSGYDVEISNPLYSESDFTFSGTAGAERTNAGTTKMGLAPDQFKNTNNNYPNVTFEVTDGYVTIDPKKVTVTIVGHNSTADYNGKLHDVSGYDVTAISDSMYSESDFTFNGTAKALRTDAGTTYMGLTADKFENTNSNFAVTFDITDGYQKIDPISVGVAILGYNSTADYNGKSHSVSGYIVACSTPLYTESDFTFSGTAEAERTDAGTTMMGLSADQFENTNSNFKNVTFTVVDGYVTINPIDVTVTITGHNDTVDYDGQAHSADGYDATADSKLYDVTKDFTFSGTAKAERTDAGTTEMGLAAEQFENTNGNFATVTFDVTDGYMTINPIDVTVTVTGHNNTVDYDGQAHSAEGYDAVADSELYDVTKDFTFSGTAKAERTDAGTTGMGLAAEQFVNTNRNFANVTFDITDGYMTVEPINVKVVVTGNSDTIDYDGKSHTVSGYTFAATSALYTESDFMFSGTAEATRTDAGTTNMGLAAEQFENTSNNFAEVTFEVTDGSLTIDPIDVTVTVTGNTDTFDYDGASHRVTGYVAVADTELYDVTKDFTFIGLAKAERTDAGTMVMGLEAARFENQNTNFATVTFDVTDGYIEIKPIEVTVTITGHISTVDFDGSAHSIDGYDAAASSDLYDVNNDFTFSGRAEAVRTNAGKTEMGLSADQFANTNSNFATVTFDVTDGYIKIDPIDVTVTVTGYHFTTDYDGEMHYAEGYYYEISDPLYTEDDFTFSGTARAERTDAGTTKMGLASNQFENTNDNFATVVFDVTDGYVTINPIDVTVMITGHNSTADYDGDAHIAEGYDAAFSDPLYTEDDFTFSGTAKAERTNAGTTNMGLKVEQFENTNSNFATVTFNIIDGYITVNAIDVTVTITGHNDTVDYDGKAHNVTGYDATASSELYDVTKDFTFSGEAKAERTNAGTTNIGLSAEQFSNTNNNFANVTFNVTDGYIKVDPINVIVTITGHNDTVDYDGKAHSVTGYDAVASSELYDVTKDFTFSGTAEAERTDAETTMMGLTAEQFENTNGNFANVTFDVTDGYIKIDPIDVTVTITGHNDTADYDGKVHSVEGYDAVASSELYDVIKDFNFSGEAKAERTNAGTTDMGLAPEQFSNTNNNFATVTFNVTDGFIKINPIDVTVTITGHNDTVDYDGKAHNVAGYDATASTDLYDVSKDFTFSGTTEAERTNAGTSNMGLTAEQFTNANGNFATVTFEVTDGFIKINPIDVTVTITGHNDTVDYDGKAHSVLGYDAAASTDLYDVSKDFTFSGTAEAERTEAGTTEMGLAPEQFSNTNNNFATVTFNVADGYVKIDPINVTVTITGHNDTVDYDGASHRVTGYDAVASSDLYDVAKDFTFSGLSKAERTDVGTTVMGLEAARFENTNSNFATVTFNVTDGYLTIVPADAIITTVPHSKEDLVYNGEEQELILAGSVDGGTLLYAVSEDEETAPADENYSTAVPTASEIGNYYIWYKVEGDSNHNSISPASFKITLADDGWITVSGNISQSDGSPISEGATVILMKGNTVVDEITADQDGSYYFTVPAGIYNIVVKSGDVTVTDIVDGQEDTIHDLVTPDADTESVLDVSASDESIVVGGLDSEANAVRTNEGISSDKKVTVKMTVTSVEESSTTGSQEISGQTQDMSMEYFDMKVEKTVDSVTTSLNETQTVLEIVIPCSYTNKRELTVLSSVGAGVQTLTQSDSKAAGTYRVDKQSGLVYVYSDRITTYAIGYKPYYSIKSEISLGSFEGNLSVKLVKDDTGETYELNNVSLDGIAFSGVPKGTYSMTITWIDGAQNTLTTPFIIK